MASKVMRKSQCDKLLAVYRRYPRGLTDTEAARRAKLLDSPAGGVWRRSADLRRQGLIEWVTTPDGSKIRRMGDFGVPVGVSVITSKGLSL